MGSQPVCISSAADVGGIRQQCELIDVRSRGFGIAAQDL
jgi:hypothetical protein